jgi:hypothetical protein
MSSPTINDVMSAYAEDAVDFARLRFHVTLDYSLSSVEQVESIAEQLYQSRPKGIIGKLFKKAPSEEELQTVYKMLGGYIGEVLRRNKGGEWAINQEFSAIGIQCGELWVFPPAKVHKRLANGSEDNLWSYFRVVIDEPWVK